MQCSTIGIIGYGHFGQFVETLLQRFAPEVEVLVYSRRAAAGEDDHFVSLTAAAQCDVVVLCGAIHEYESQLHTVLQHARPDTVIVDVATVKQYPQQLLEKYGADRAWISCHPMFGPESYKKHAEDVSGFRIVITGHTLTETDFEQLRQLLAVLGFVVIELSAEEHDRLLAETLFLTHYIGQTMQTAGFVRTMIDTVSFSYLMDAVESVINDRQLFADVYHFNPYCQEVAERFHQAQTDVLAQLPQQTSD